VDTYSAFRERVEQMGLDGVWEVKPVVNGGELMTLLPQLKKGPVIGQILREQVDWMIENPGKEKEDVREWIAEKFKQYT